jgi:putative hydrolase of the HAD superfamily
VSQHPTQTNAARRAVICDFGGVLTSPLIGAFAAVQERSGVTVEELSAAMAKVIEATGRHPLHELEKGNMTEADFLAALEAQLDPHLHLHGFRETYFAGLHPNRAMIDYVGELRTRGLRTALLTNNVREWEPLWRAKLPDVDRDFEVIVDSAFVGMRKPDPEIYQLTVERLGGDISPENCVFIDDTDANCATARALGMHAIHFLKTDRAIDEIERAIGGT